MEWLLTDFRFSFTIPSHFFVVRHLENVYDWFTIQFSLVCRWAGHYFSKLTNGWTPSVSRVARTLVAAELVAGSVSRITTAVTNGPGLVGLHILWWQFCSKFHCPVVCWLRLTPWGVMGWEGLLIHPAPNTQQELLPLVPTITASAGYIVTN